jgi:hypothetical protein
MKRNIAPKQLHMIVLSNILFRCVCSVPLIILSNIICAALLLSSGTVSNNSFRCLFLRLRYVGVGGSSLILKVKYVSIWYINIKRLKNKKKKWDIKTFLLMSYPKETSV